MPAPSRRLEAPRPARRRGFTMVEAVLCTLITAVVVGGALNAVTTVSRTRTAINDRVEAQLVADALLREALGLAFIDPTDASGVLGLNAGESRTADRTQLDDVDDYEGYAASPITDRTGSAWSVPASWRVEVTVAYPSPTNMNVDVATGMLKRVHVRVLDGSGRVLARASGLRSQAWSSAQTMGGT